MRGSKIQNFGYLCDEKRDLSQTSSALNLWIMCDFFLHVAEDKSVTLLCFDAPNSVVLRFGNLLTKTSWTDVLEEPYLLFVIIFDELHEILDSISITLGSPLRKVDGAANDQAGSPLLNLRHMHEVQKWVLLSILCVF